MPHADCHCRRLWPVCQTSNEHSREYFLTENPQISSSSLHAFLLLTLTKQNYATLLIISSEQKNHCAHQLLPVKRNITEIRNPPHFRSNPHTQRDTVHIEISSSRKTIASISFLKQPWKPNQACRLIC